MLLALTSSLVLLCALAACSDDAEPPASDGSVGDGAMDAAPPIKPVAMQELLDACVRASACGVRTYPILGNCLEAYFKLSLPQGLSPLYDEIYKCINAAKGDCAAIAACYGKRSDCDNSYKDRCEGDVAVTCDLIEKKVFAFDCTKAKMKCQIKKDGLRDSAICALDTCFSSFGNMCSGNRLLNCVNSLIEVYECEADGLICSSTSKGAECIGESSSKCMNKGYTPSCQGTKRVTCVGGYEHFYDCSKQKNIATSCVGADCAVSGKECDHDLNRCAGEQLEACLDGSWGKIDCKQLGLGACQVQGISANCSKI